MKERIQIGIVGSGKVGKALGSWIAKVGFPVAFTSRNLKHAEEAASAPGQEARALPLKTVLEECEIILLTLPFKQIGTMLDSKADAWREKIVVDVTNPVSDDRKSLL